MLKTTLKFWNKKKAATPACKGFKINNNEIKAHVFTMLLLISEKFDAGQITINTINE